MTHSTAARLRHTWVRRLGRILAVVAQLVILLAPVAEAREERALAAHVESPSTRHPLGHRPEACAACILVGVHSQASARPELPPIERAERTGIQAAVQLAASIADAPANGSRAPPTVV